jgi:chromosome segregation ATPase
MQRMIICVSLVCVVAVSFAVRATAQKKDCKALLKAVDTAQAEYNKASAEFKTADVALKKAEAALERVEGRIDSNTKAQKTTRNELDEVNRLLKECASPDLSPQQDCAKLPGRKRALEDRLSTLQTERKGLDVERKAHQDRVEASENDLADARAAAEKAKAALDKAKAEAAGCKTFR